MPIKPASSLASTSHSAPATAILRPLRDGTGGVPSLRFLAFELMHLAALRYSPEDPGSLVESCQKTLEWILWKHGKQPIARCWIDSPYTEEEITLLEEEVLPAMEHFLRRVAEIEDQLEAAQKLAAEVALLAP